MNRTAEIAVESQKEWATPELKKIDLEQITAHRAGSGADGGGLGANATS